jgi:hypothetical protein
MRIISYISLTLVCISFWTCQNFEDATPSSRQTFIKLFEGPYNWESTAMEIVDDGYVIVGNMYLPQQGSAFDSTVTLVFKTDKNGNRVSEYNFYTGGTGKAIKRLANGGYIVVGDSIKRDLNPDDVANAVISSARFLFINENFDRSITVYLADESSSTIKTDFYGGTVTTRQDNGDIIILCTYVEGIGTQANVPEKPFIIALNSNLTVKWTQQYDLIDRNYRNTKSIHTNNNKIFWGSAITREFGESKFSYVTIPVVEDNSVFVNYSTLGEGNDQLFTTRDIQPARNKAFGFGVVGTYSEPNAADGSKSNMFFVRTDANGSIIEGSARYFDAILSANNTPLSDSTLSEIRDEGEAITSTKDGGFVLAGSMLTTPVKGNGQKDIFLVKVDAFGNMVWNKTIGGAGNEVVSSIKETSDGGLLICGTNTLGNASIIFLIKTDKNGELKN